MIISSKRSDFKPLICALCHNEILETSNIYQTMVCFAIICDDCNKKFSERDIDLMINMFLAYGGFFGELKEKPFSVEESVKKVLGSLKEHKFFTDIQECNVRLLHQALLHGINPQEYIEKLQTLQS